MQFLLSQGADGTEVRRHYSEDISIGNERGAKEISKWLGVTWEELVESNRLVRINWLRKRRGVEPLTHDELP